MDLTLFLLVYLTSLTPQIVSEHTYSTLCSSSTTSETYTCSKNGRYAVPGDTTCKQYYYCYKRNSGQFTQTLYTCSIGLFNNDTQSCDTTYECPCSTSTSEMTTTTSGASTTQKTISAVSTTQEATSSTSTTQKTTNSTSQVCSVSNSNETFTCSVNGRYAVPSDTTCTQYYYCYKLRNGSFSQTLYTCSVGLFNSDTQSCDTTYECPCFSRTTESPTPTSVASTTQKTTSSARTTQEVTSVASTTQDANSKPSTTRETTSSTSTTQKSTSSTSQVCSVINSNETFICSVNGRYAVPGDTTCTQYYYCYKLRNGSFSQTVYTCSVGLFNRDTQSCDTTYECPCFSSTTESTTPTSVASTTQKTTSPASTTQDATSATSTIQEATSSASTTQKTTSSTSQVCNVSNSRETFNCSANGRYAVPGDTTCTQYYYCYKLRNGSFSQTLYTCSVGLFNSDTQSCDTTYECPCSSSTTESTTPTSVASTTQKTTSSTSQACNVSNSKETFICPANGRYAVPGDTTCTQYYYCYKLRNGSVTQTLYTCSVGLFNSDTQSCDTTYECPCFSSTTESTTPTSVANTTQKTTSPASTTKEETSAASTTKEATSVASTTQKATSSTSSQVCSVSNSTDTFTCSVNGRYAVPGDTTCTQYYYCYKLRNGSFSQTLYTCSVGLFNRDTQSCNTTYECPCFSSTTESTTPTSVASTTQKTTSPASTTQEATSVTSTTQEATSSASTTQKITSSTSQVCSVSNSNETFTCSVNGRYAVPGDTTCTQYYYCYKLRNGSFTQTLYTCSVGLFKSDTQSCDTTYECPCISSTTESTIPTSVASTTQKTTSPASTTQDATSATSTTQEATSSASTTQKITSSTSQVCNVSNLRETLNCSANGRYAVPGDTTCTQYYYCYKLRNGSFIQTLYTCSVGLFNSDRQSCDTTYECPCFSSTTESTTPTSVASTTQKTTSSGSTTQEVTSAASTTQDATSKPSSTRETTSSTSTTQKTTSSTSQVCSLSNSNETFICKANGRYAVPGDTTCTQYYYCYKLRNGSFSQTLYTCSVGLFNSDTQSCDTTYECPCFTSTTESTTPTSVASTTQKTTSSGSTTQEVTSAASTTQDATSKPSSTRETTSSTSTTQKTTSSTSQVCSLSNSNETFICKANGRYAVPGDTTCTQYYYCYKLRNGSFSQTLYTCSVGLFNSDTQSCDTTYECPCSSSTTESTTPTSVASTTQKTTSPASTTQEATSAASTTKEATSSASTTQKTTSSTSQACNVSKSKETFICPANGRYAVPGDTTCTQYYYCYKLRNGSVTQTLYTCSVGLFNSDTQSCDTTYECPCISSTTESTTPTSVASTTQKTTSPASTTQEATSAASTTKEATSSASTTQKTTSSTSQVCSVSNSKETFICSANGRYAVPGDTTCTQYYYCYKFRNGSFSQTLYTCSVGLFNSDTQSCDTTYECPCFTSTTESTTPTSVASTTQKTTTSASTTQEATSAASTTQESTSVASTTQKTTSSTFSQVCSVSNLNETFTCSVNGRYAVPGDTTCTQYYYCYKLSNGSFIQTLYTCSIGLFNNDTQSCDKTYECPCSTTTSSITSTIEAVTSASDNCTASTESFICLEAGKFSDPADLTCKKYYYCRKIFFWFIASHLSCSSGYFNPTNQTCDTTYNCPCSEEGDSSVSNSTSCAFSNAPFTCSEKGDFADPSDSTCSKYYTCLQLWSGMFIKMKHTCRNSLFNPDGRKCDKSYTCTCST